jgi:hypothetical protein
MIWPHTKTHAKECPSVDKGRKIWKKICSILKEISYIIEYKRKES